MNKTLVGVGVVTGVLGVIFLFSIIGVNNNCITQEATIKAQYGQNQNNYDNMWKRIKEVAQVPSMYTEDLKKVYDSAISGRYGANGSKAMFNWIKEHNPNFDGTLYKQVQQVIESGRLSFADDQKILLDKKRGYETYLNQFPTNVIGKNLLGFPKIELAKYDIVTSEETTTAFETKKVDEIKLR